MVADKLYILAKGGLDIRGQWERALAGDCITALVSCPTCGRVLSLLPFNINAQGFVTPSLVCSASATEGRPSVALAKEGCGFHAYVKLDGWKEEHGDA